MALLSLYVFEARIITKLMPLFEKDSENVDLVSYYARLAEKYRSYADEAPEYRELYMFAYMLADLLHHKAIWRREAPKAIRAGARDKAAELARFALRLKCQTEAFAERQYQSLSRYI